MTYTKRIRDFVYKRYQQETNMSLSELLNWKVNALSKVGSLSRKPINLAIQLKRKKKGQWLIGDYKNAMRAVSYLKKAKKIISKKKIDNLKYTRGQIALKNWGFDVRKARRK